MTSTATIVGKSVPSSSLQRGLRLKVALSALLLQNKAAAGFSSPKNFSVSGICLRRLQPVTSPQAQRSVPTLQAKASAAIPSHVMTQKLLQCSPVCFTQWIHPDFTRSGCPFQGLVCLGGPGHVLVRALLQVTKDILVACLA